MRCLSCSFSAVIRVCIHFLHVVRQFPHRLSAQITRGHYADYPWPLRGLPAAITRITRGHYADYPRPLRRLPVAITWITRSHYADYPRPLRGLPAAITRITRGHYADYPRPLCGLPAAITRILRGRYADYLRRSARLSTAVRAKLPRNSAEKVKFSVSRTVIACIPVSDSSATKIVKLCFFHYLCLLVQVVSNACMFSSAGRTGIFSLYFSSLLHNSDVVSLLVLNMVSYAHISRYHGKCGISLWVIGYIPQFELTVKHLGINH